MTFYELLTEAIREFEVNGYQSQEQLAAWESRIRSAATGAMVSEDLLTRRMVESFRATFRKQIDNGGILRTHPGIARFTLDRVKPSLRAELDRRIMASANLIKLNRQAAIEKTLQRFSGWATSIPAGGSRVIDKQSVKTDVRKSLAQLPFAERRVIVDQGHKFLSSLNNIVAVDGGALAGKWHSHWRAPGYDYRQDHKDRDQRIYLIRGNWAQVKGLVKVGPDGYADQITAPGEEVFCSCSYVYLYNLRDLPDTMLTKVGREAIKR